MADEADDELESKDQPTEDVENTEEVEETVVDTESEDLEALKEKNRKLFERAKKAEAEAKELKTKVKAPEPSEKKGGLSSLDLYALIEAKVLQDDISEVTDYAKLKGISVAEALKSNVVKTILSERAEERKTAAAAHTTGARRGNSQVSDDTLLNKASRGELPESEAEIARLFKARKGLK
jgi:hypothetical protein